MFAGLPPLTPIDGVMEDLALETNDEDIENQEETSVPPLNLTNSL
jgi:hypothetical protein